MKIEKKVLTEQIKIVLQDEFVVEIMEKAEELLLKFLNGQIFRLKIKEE